MGERFSNVSIIKPKTGVRYIENRKRKDERYI